MKIHRLLLVIFFFYSVGVSAQDFTVSTIQKNTMKNQAVNLVDNYETSLNNLGDQSLSVSEKEYFIADILETFFSDQDVMVFNDLDPNKKEPEDLKVDVYLSNIIVKFSKGVNIDFRNVKVSDPYYLDENNAFIKVEAVRHLKGFHLDSAVENSIGIDFYLKYELYGEGSFRPPSIYNISIHSENLENFNPVGSEKQDEMLEFTFINPSKSSSFKRGKSYQIIWRGNGNTKPVKLELMKDGNVIDALNARTTSRSYEWMVPVNLDLGDDYQMKISNINNNENFLLSTPFTIKRKIPLLVKIVPLVGVAAVTGYLLFSPSEEGPKDEILPGPPSPK